MYLFFYQAVYNSTNISSTFLFGKYRLIKELVEEAMIVLGHCVNTSLGIGRGRRFSRLAPPGAYEAYM